MRNIYQTLRLQQGFHDAIDGLKFRRRRLDEGDFLADFVITMARRLTDENILADDFVVDENRHVLDTCVADVLAFVVIENLESGDVHRRRDGQVNRDGALLEILPPHVSRIDCFVDAVQQSDK